jgi:Bacterial Ig-like domain (group 3)
MWSVSKAISFSLFMMVAPLLYAAASPTTTTLAISPSSNVLSGTVVTLTAIVTDSAPVAKGTVNFCNTAMTQCLPGDGLYGTAQLTSSGTATLRLSFGVGINNVKANFVSTGIDTGSSSLASSICVSCICQRDDSDICWKFGRLHFERECLRTRNSSSSGINCT